VGAMKHFHPYLMGAPFTVRTDHNSLVWLCHFKELDGQLARWLETLAQYDFEIVYRKGIKHGNADGLLRRSCGSCKHCEKAEQLEHSVMFLRTAIEWLPYKEVWPDEGQGEQAESVCAEPWGEGAVAMATDGKVKHGGEPKSILMDQEGDQEGEKELNKEEKCEGLPEEEVIVMEEKESGLVEGVCILGVNTVQRKEDGREGKILRRGSDEQGEGVKRARAVTEKVQHKYDAEKDWEAM
jgi:hypothetical protein